MAARPALDLVPGDVVCVALPPGPAWTELVREIWDAGAALLAIDHRLPEPEVRRLLDRARPTVLLTPDGSVRQPGGLPEEHGVALVVPTSGTGGEPKLVRFDRTAVAAAVAASAVALGTTPQDRWLCCLPLGHVGGLLVLLRGVLLGAPVVVHPRFDPHAVALERGVAFTSLVPTMLGRLLEAGAPLGDYRGILVGGAPLPPELRARAEAAGAAIVETYGLTESCGGVVYDGRPLPGTELRLSDEGEIQLRGPTLMLGYRSDPALSAAALTPDGWLRTGDAGEIDRDGRLHVLGRADDLINTGGEKVWPRQVEAVLAEQPKVADVAVGGRPDPEWGERVVAWVVPTDPAAPPTLAELRDAVARLLPRYAAPRELVLVQALPRTSLGKLRRSALPPPE